MSAAHGKGHPLDISNSTTLLIQGISTDRIIDVRRLLCVNTETCHITNFSLSHEVRGRQLKDTVDVSALKPCLLSLTEDEYDEERAVAHVRRLLDIIACTTFFGPSSSIKPPDSRRNASPSTEPPFLINKKKPPSKQHSHSTAQTPPMDAVDVDGETFHSSPKLGSFYDFFSLSHLTSPLQYIKKVGRRQVDELLPDEHLFSLDVKLCNGKLVNAEACRRGFFSLGKQPILCHNLVDLLRHQSRAFFNAYDDLIKAFSERNKERQVRDTRAFLLHSMFVDVAILRAVSAVKHVLGNSETSVGHNECIYSERVGDLCITVTKDAHHASIKVATKIDGNGTDQTNLI